MFSTSFNNKSNACGKNDAKYLSIYVILHVKHQKVPILAIFTWFLILGKIQDGGQDGDEILQHIKTSGEGFYRSPPPQNPCCTTVSQWICVYVRGLKTVCGQSVTVLNKGAKICLNRHDKYLIIRHVILMLENRCHNFFLKTPFPLSRNITSSVSTKAI